MARGDRSTLKNRIVAHGTVDPNSLFPNPKNWRRHSKAQQAALAGVMDQVGWVQDVIVNRRTGRLIDGHLRVALAIERGEPSVPVLYVDLDEAEEALILATFDPIGAMAAADAPQLEQLLAEVQTADAAVQALLADVAREAGVTAQPLAGLTDPDAAPPPPAQPVSESGDLWHCGAQRVLCGDARDPAQIGRVLAEERAAWAWTDPPYGVAYTGKTAARLTIRHDDAAAVPALLAEAFRSMDTVLAPGAPVYCACPAGPVLAVFLAAFTAAGWHLHQITVWVKDRFVLGHADHHFRHDLVLYGWKPGAARPWFGGRVQDSVFEVARPATNPDHPTAKPVALVEAQLRNSTAPGSLGLDPFAGSGTALIAAERLGRRCAAVEIDPRYVDVAVRRWEAHTGRTAVLAGDGRPFAENTEARHGR